jgi:uncharacterized protein (TIGR02597 family)
MKARLQYLLGFLLLAMPAGLRAESVAATPPAGFYKLTARGASDSMLAVPLVKRTVLLAKVVAVGENSVTLAADSAADGAYAPSFEKSWYAQFVTGALAGRCYKIVGNRAGVFSLATDGEDLRSHALGVVATGEAGDLVRIRPYWTVADVFGGGETAPILDPVADFGGGPYLESDAILLPDNEGVEVERMPLTICFVAGAGWRVVGNPTADLAGQPLPPGVPFTVRRQRSESAEMVLVGYVSQEPYLVRLPALAAGEDRDVAIALAHPENRSLADSELFSEAGPPGAIESSPDSLNVRDSLQEFDAVRRGFALPPAQCFHVTGAAWYVSETRADDHVLHSGTGYLLRLRGSRPVRYWKQSAPVWNP